MALTYLKIFADMEETLSLYSDEERGRLLSAMMAYSFRGEEPEFIGAERFVWPMLRNHIDSCEVRSEKMKENGKQNNKKTSKAEANESKEKQTETNESNPEANESKTKPIQEQEQEQEQDHEHDHDQEQKRAKGKRARFVPPTPEEAQAYMLENGGTHIQAAKFHAHWSSKGWMRGRTPMKDWKASAREWLLKDQEWAQERVQSRPAAQQPPSTTNPFLQMLAEEGYSP